jgi:alpha-tubulin suppressor-like RCC1 family protein
LNATGKAYCWGGTIIDVDGNMTEVLRPTLVDMPAGITFTKISNGGVTACAIATNGHMYCWGDNYSGQLGDGTNVIKTSANPVTMPTVTSTGAVIPFTTLSVGMGTTCALDSSGQAYCWGWNDVGMVGDDSTVDRNTPVKVEMPGLSFVALSASAYKHFCALDSSGNAYCWGANSDGQLGDGTTTDRLKPVPVTMPAGVAFSQITVGAYHSCAMTTGTTNKHIYCWGYNGYGQVGDGSTTRQLVPQLITNPTTNLVGVYAGTRHTCAVFQSGSYCWGDNSNGQLGNGQLGDGTDPYQPVTTPVAVTMPASTVFAYMSLGESHTCAVSTGSIAYCWGNNNDGQLGDDTENTDRLLPVRVVQPDGRIP